ncbi:MAG: DUF3857 domain-containing protein [Deltaproteobacteria bacterium]|nr:DUF3857 domain-containing protein [Deltaproteobacteria bacterium]
MKTKWTVGVALTAVLTSGSHPLPATRPTPAADLARIQPVADRLASRRAALGALADIYDLVDLRSHLFDPSAVDDQIARSLGALAERGRLHPIAGDHLRLLAAQCARRSRDSAAPARAARWIAATGLVTRFALLGPFDNTGGAVFADEVIDESQIDLRARETGKSGEIGWRIVTGGEVDGFLDLEARVAPAKESIVYALFTIEATRPTRLALRLGTSDQVCVRIGREPARCFDEKHAWAFEQHAVGLALPAGTTPILLRLGHFAGHFRLSARLTLWDGRPVPAGAVVVGLPDLDAVVAISEGRARFAPAVDIVDELRRAADRSRGAARPEARRELAKVLLALHAMDERTDPTAATVAVDRALELAPDDAELWRLRARAVAVHDRNLERDALQRALELAPRDPSALLALASNRLRQQLDRQAAALAERAVAVAPDDPLALMTLVRARRSVDPDPDAGGRLIDAYLRRHAVDTTAPPPPDLPVQAATLAWLDRLRGERRTEDAAAWASRLAENDRMARPAVSALLDRARRDGDVEKAAALYLDLAAQRPQSRTPLLQRARLLAWDRQTERAVNELRALVAGYPDHADVATALGEALLLAGDRSGAARAWQRSLALQPQQPELKRRLDAIAAVTDPLDAFRLDLEALRALPTPAAARPFGVYVLGHTIATRLYDNGLYSTVEDYAVRLLDRNFADSIRNRSVPFVPGRERLTVLVAERIDADGRSVPPKSMRDRGHRGRSGGVYSDRDAREISFGQIEVGDVVHIRTRLDAVGQLNLFGDFFGQIELAHTTWPTHRFELVVEAPVNRPLFLHAAGLRQKVQPSPDDPHLVRYRISSGELPGVHTERWMPPLIELVPYVSISTYRSWDDMLRWYAQMIQDQYQLDDETRALARRLVSGARDVRERVRRIQEHVIKKTRYVGIELGIHGWKPYRAALVHRRGYGDCKDKATLLVAMLDAIGVEAKLVLLRTKQLGELAAEPATMWAFNHAIAYVPALDLFVDGTAEFSGLDELPDMDQGALAIVVGRDGSHLFKRPPERAAADNLNLSDYTIAIDPDGNASLNGIERFRGDRSASMRRRYADPATRHELLEKEFSRTFAGARLERVEFSDLAELDAEVWYRFDAQIPKRAQLSGDGLVLPLSLYPHELTAAYASTKERAHDLVLDRAWRTRNVMHYRLPAGFSAPMLPAGVRIDTPHLGLVQRIERTDDGFVVDETTEIRSRRIGRGDYPAFRAACLQGDAAMQRRVKLVRAAAAGSAPAGDGGEP